MSLFCSNPLTLLPCFVAHHIQSIRQLLTTAYGNVGHCILCFVYNTRTSCGSLQPPFFSIPLQHYQEKNSVAAAARCSFQETRLDNETYLCTRPCCPKYITLPTIQYEIPTLHYITWDEFSYSVHVKQQQRQLTSTAQFYGKYLLRSCRKTHHEMKMQMCLSLTLAYAWTDTEFKHALVQKIKEGLKTGADLYAKFFSLHSGLVFCWNLRTSTCLRNSALYAQNSYAMHSYHESRTHDDPSFAGQVTVLQSHPV